MEEFVDDVQFIFNQFERRDAPQNDLMLFGLVQICNRHITKYGRLVFTDLRTYVDELLIIFEHFEEARGIRLSLEEGCKVWMEYYQASFKIFENDIWVQSKVNPNEIVKWK